MYAVISSPDTVADLKLLFYSISFHDKLVSAYLLLSLSFNDFYLQYIGTVHSYACMCKSIGKVLVQYCSKIRLLHV